MNHKDTEAQRRARADTMGRVEGLRGWQEAIIVGLILASSFAIRWPFRHVPLIRDEGEYAYLGQQILHGAIPYRDVYNQKTPFAFYFFAAIQVAFGSSLEALRVATTL